MLTLVINTSFTPNSSAGKVSALVANEFYGQLTDLTSFKDAFTGTYLYEDSVFSPYQATCIKQLIKADNLVFVVSTYYKLMPGMFKNFLDMVRIKAIYENKTIGLIANSHKNQDFGARATLTTLMGISEFHNSKTTFVPYIPIIDPETPDMYSLREYRAYFRRFSGEV
ncbi:MAG: NAD(P)H-dependent oxidoreductase [bacterium]|nr:NAD(P)H-dependent oxidoreductase [bacterium]